MLCFRRLLIVLSLLLSSGWSEAWGAEPIEAFEPAADRAVDFYADVYPMLEAKCLACHNRTTQESDLVLEDVPAILKGGASGVAVVPGKPEESLLFKVCARVEEPAMPPLPNKVGAMALTPTELGFLKRWIADGAKPGKSNPSAAAIGWQALPSTMVSSYALAVGPRDRFVAFSRANSIVICDLVAGREIARLGDPLLRSVKTASLLPLYDRDVAHFDVVSSLAFSPDGEWIASGGYREIKLWQRQHNAITVQFQAAADVVAASVNSDGSSLLLALADGTLSLWDLEIGEQVKTLGPIEGLNGAAMTGDGSRALVTSSSGRVAVWNIREGKELAVFPAEGPTGRAAISPDGRWGVTAHADGVLKRWILSGENGVPSEGGEGQASKPGPAVESVVITEDCTRVLSVTSDGAVLSFNAELNDRRELARVAAGTRVATIGMNGQLTVTLANEGRRGELMRAGAKEPVVLPAAPELSLAVTALEAERAVVQSQLALANERLKQAEEESKVRADAFAKAEMEKTKLGEAVTKAKQAVADFEGKLKAAQEKLAAAVEDEALKKEVAGAEEALKKARKELMDRSNELAGAERDSRFADTAAQAGRREVTARKGAADAVQERLTANEQQIAAAKKELEESPLRMAAVAIAPGGHFLASGHSDGRVHLWAAADGRWLESFSGPSSAVTSLTFSNETTLVSTAADRSVVEWNIAPQWKLSAVLGAKAESRLDISESPLVDRVLALAFSPDGRSLASGGGEPSRSGELIVWDAGSQSVRRAFPELHSDTVNTLAFSRDGERLASGSADKFLRVSEVETGKLLRTYEGHTGHVQGVAWKPDGSSLASGGADGAVKIWDSETGEQRKSIAAVDGQVTAVAWPGLDATVAAATSKNKCLVIDSEKGRVSRDLNGAAGYTYCLSTLDRGGQVVAAGEDGVLRIWQTADGKLLRDFAPKAAND